MTAPGAATGLLTDVGIDLAADRGRVVTRLFVPGREELGPGDSRAGSVVQRILGLAEGEVTVAVAELVARFAPHHRAIERTFHEHAALVTSRIDPSVALSAARLLLLGAAFTHEYSIEGAALCNPSAVLHPDQPAGPGASAASARFVMSVRGIGEGHRSSIGFRTGTVTPTGVVTVDPPGPFPHLGCAEPGPNERSVIRAQLAALGENLDDAAYVLDALPEWFGDADLDEQSVRLAADLATRGDTHRTIETLRRLSQSFYRVVFPAEVELTERVLWPHSPAERHGMEDVRLVRFVDHHGGVRYHGTYTAYDGIHIAQHLLTTTDFATFALAPMTGEAAVGKGLALFPRRIGGRYVALSRADRETNSVAFSDDLRCWGDAVTIQAPTRPWEILQLGNCGSPIETAEGWLVLTHGVGPMRTYAIGALLLDLDDPTIVRARSVQPIIASSGARRGGYVPNVVYTCGGFAHGDVLVLPYGVDDESIRFATGSIDRLLRSLGPAA